MAFLDQDDLFHQDKLKVHVEYLEGNPGIGFTYNARFELNHGTRTNRDIWQPPIKLSLADIVLEHQLSPTEMVLRREWAQDGTLWDENHPFHGGEIILLGHLFMDGCKFAHVGRALNYRRHHSGRFFSDMRGIVQSEQKVSRQDLF